MNPRIQGRVAVLGLGIIGSRSFARLRDAGVDAICWNRTPQGLAEEASSPAAAVDGAHVISLYLKDAPAVREVIARIGHLLHAGQTLLNHSTLDLDTTLWLAGVCEARGCRFLDAPFTGSKLAALNGQLVYYIGGDEDLAAELEPFLSITSRSRLFCGPVGSATVIKLATNLISACTVQAMAESLAIATRHGVAADCLIRAVAENASGSPLAAMKFPAMVEGNYETHFSLSNMAKDSRYMLALAAAAGIETPGIAAVSKRMTELCESGLGGLDYSSLAKPYLDGS
jgi:3-hydroxyisobutyrate dehydrogenase-like beta-hydroxyacid dehydrogenase